MVRLFTYLVAVLVVIMCVPDAHAQRRRKRRRPPPPKVEAPAEPVAAEAPPPQEAAEADPAATADEAPPPVEGEAAPPAAEPTAVASGPDLSQLRAELSQLMDDMVKARTRVAVLGKALFKTKLRISVQDLTGDEHLLERLTVKLDGAPVHRGDGKALRGDESTQVFEGFAAPGPHVLTLEAEVAAREDDAFGYAVRESYRFVVARSRRSDVELILEDGSDMADDFPDDQEGEYEVRSSFSIEARELDEE